MKKTIYEHLDGLVLSDNAVTSITHYYFLKDIDEITFDFHRKLFILLLNNKMPYYKIANELSIDIKTLYNYRKKIVFFIKKVIETDSNILSYFS